MHLPSHIVVASEPPTSAMTATSTPLCHYRIGTTESVDPTKYSNVQQPPCKAAKTIAHGVTQQAKEITMDNLYNLIAPAEYKPAIKRE